MADLFDNPMGLMGFEFVEFASPTPDTLEPVFEKLGFTLVAQHRSKDVRAVPPGRHQLHRQPRAEERRRRTSPPSTARRRAAWRFASGIRTRPTTRALELGAQPIEMPTGPMELRLPAIKGIGGAPLYLIDRFEDGKSIYDIDFEFIDGVERHPAGHGLKLDRSPDAQRLPRPHGVLGRASTSGSSTSARSATSTSRASTPA